MTVKPLTSGLRAVHPGELLREDVIPALGRSKAEITRLLEISRQTLYDLLGEKLPIIAPVALRIGKLCGNGGRIWYAMQQAYDLRVAEAEIADELEAIQTLDVA